MNTVLEFKTALEAVAARTDIDSDVIVPRTYTFDEIVAIEKEIIEANKNRTSDYNINNFENDSKELLEKHIDFLKDFDNQTKNRSLWFFVRKEKDHLFFENKFTIRLYEIPKSDYYLIPYVRPDAHKLPHYGINKIDDSMIGIRIVLIENSFSDLFLKSIDGSYSQNIHVEAYFRDGKINELDNHTIEITRYYTS